MITFKIFLFRILSLAVNIYFYVVLVYCVSTFFVKNRYTPWFVFLSDLVEPPLVWIKRITRGHTTVGRFDLSPIILLFLLEAAVRALKYLVY